MWFVMIVSGYVADVVRTKHILRTTTVRKLSNFVGESNILRSFIYSFISLCVVCMYLLIAELGWPAGSAGLGRKWVRNFRFQWVGLGVSWAASRVWNSKSKKKSVVHICNFVSYIDRQIRFSVWSVILIAGQLSFDVWGPVGMGWIGSWVHKFIWQWLGWVWSVIWWSDGLGR